MGKGKPFFEVFASALSQDYRFPVLEFFVFLYAVATVVLTGPANVSINQLTLGTSADALTFILVSSLTEFPLFVFAVLLLKNIAFNVGSDLDKGIMQTYLTYPLKRRSLLTAKLMSSLGIAVLLFLGVQTFALFVIASDMISPYMGTLVLSYAGILSFPLLIAGLVLILTLFLKRGGIAMIVGIILYFGSEILSSLLQVYAISTGSEVPLKISAILNPHFALQQYYMPSSPYRPTESLWTLGFADALFYLGASYILVVLVFALAYLYFERRLEI